MRMKVRGSEPHYAIPLRYRKMENLHILFWLFKDLAWCLDWKVVGISMIAPTFIISLVILWRTRSIVAELCHNAAISVWIMANSYWMITEFFGFDDVVVTGDWTFKHMAVIPFVIGLLFVGYYYLYYQWIHRRRSPVLTDTGLEEADENTVVPIG
ncbi:MAG TPA: hypothetical protein VK907_04005 [Phnomibacter sp.]|nr:hypothetical protein [Phnomibacter sp.]